MLEGLPFFKIGITLAVFQTFGKYLLLMQLFIKIVMCWTMFKGRCFNTREGIPSNPYEVLLGKYLSIYKISSKAVYKNEESVEAGDNAELIELKMDIVIPLHRTKLIFLINLSKLVCTIFLVEVPSLIDLGVLIDS